MSGVPGDAQTPASRSHTSVKPSIACSSRNEQRVTEVSELRVTLLFDDMVSAEGHISVNEQVYHHWVVSAVPRDAQTPASWSHRTYTRVDPRVWAMPMACSDRMNRALQIETGRASE